MKYRRLGHSGIEVSEIGFGAWGIGGVTAGLTSYGATDDGVSLGALRRALDLGINFFDTSNVYGDGRSEQLIGHAFASDREKVVIATKAGFSSWDREPDFSPATIVRSCEQSLVRLRTDYVDLLQLHNPSPKTVAQGDAIGALDRLVRDGKARAWGLSIRSPLDAIAVLDVARPTALQVNLNMLDVRAVECGLFDKAVAHDASIIARTPLCFGFLSGHIRPDTAFPPGDHRLGWKREQIAVWCDGADRALGAVPLPPGSTKTQAALRFCLSFQAVATVIPGMLRPEEVEENAGASLLGPLPSDTIDAVLSLNRSHSFFIRG